MMRRLLLVLLLPCFFACPAWSDDEAADDDAPELEILPPKGVEPGDELTLDKPEDTPVNTTSGDVPLETPVGTVCTTKGSGPEVTPDIECITKKLGPTLAPTEHWSALPHHVKAAPCRRSEPFSDEEIEGAIGDWDSADKDRVSRSIHGVTFENESPRLLALFEHLTTFHTWASEEKKKKDGQKTFTSSCRKVLCAVKDIFGDKIGPRLLFMQGRFGMNGSQFAYENADEWRLDELNDVLTGLSDLPPSVLPFTDNKQLIRYKRGFRDGFADDFTLANAAITIYDRWSDHGSENRQQVVVHEVGHVLSGEYGVDKSSKWAEISGWTSKKVPKEVEVTEDGVKKTKTVIEDEHTVAKPETVPSKYGMKSPAEDQAETMVAYRYNPEELKARSPEKYELMKEVFFDGLEYTDEDSCQPSNSITAKLNAKVAKQLKSPSVPTKFVSHAKKECGEHFARLLDKGPVPQQLDSETIRCLSRSIGRQALGEAVKSEDLKYPEFTVKSLGLRGSTPAMGKVAAALSAWQARDAFKNKVRAAIAQCNTDRTYLLYGKATVKSVCDNWQEQGWQCADGLGKEFGEGTLYVYNNRQAIGKVLGSACRSIYAKKKKLTPFTDAEIDAELVRYFP